MLMQAYLCKISLYFSDNFRSLLAESFKGKETSAGLTGQQLWESHVQTGNSKSLCKHSIWGLKHTRKSENVINDWVIIIHGK